MTKQRSNISYLKDLQNKNIARILFSGREEIFFICSETLLYLVITRTMHFRKKSFDSMFRSRNFSSERNILHIESYKSRLLDYASRTDEPHVARGHSNATLTLPDAITRGETWRTSERTQCLPYWLACSVLRNVINTSLTHAPNPAVPRNVQPFNFYSAATALPSSLLIFLPPSEGIRTHTRAVAARNTRTYY